MLTGRDVFTMAYVGMFKFKIGYFVRGAPSSTIFSNATLFYKMQFIEMF